MPRYLFEIWSDGDKRPTRPLTVKGPVSLSANYKEVIATTTVRFNGSVSAQEKAGETVTITVTQPDGSIQTLTALTDANGAYAMSMDYSAPGDYQARAHIDADAMYQAADSPVVPFKIAAPGLQPRTISLNIVVA